MKRNVINILITAPSFNNLSGISTLVASIMETSGGNYRYFHFELGKIDNTKKRFAWFGNQLLLGPRLLWAIVKTKIDIVHLNAPLEKPAVIRDFFIAFLSRVLLRRKLIIHIHGGVLLLKAPPGGSLFSFLIKKMLLLANSILVLSKLEYETILKDYHVRSIVLPNAIKNVFTYPAGKDFSGRLTFVFLGRIVKSKGIFLIAEAFNDLNEYFNYFDFHIYGMGPALDDFIHKLSQIKGLNFTYLGIARDEQKRIAFNNAHIFLLPSLYGEGLPVAMLEAMAGGCIPLVSDNASMPEVIKDNENGFIVEMENKEDLKNAIINLLKNRNTLSAISRSAHSTILKKYTFENYLGILHNIYDQVNTKLTIHDMI